MSYWEEETTPFTGSIRRSGSSYVVTIPVEIFQRFMLREGQPLKIFGMIRKTPEFQGMVGIFLGTFKVKEKYYGFELRIRGFEALLEEESGKPSKTMPAIEKLAEKHAATSYFFRVLEDGTALIRMHFGCITAKSIIKPKTRSEVEKIKDEVVAEILKAGGKVESAEIFEEKAEWHMVDPSMVAKSPYRDSEAIEWEWKI